MGTDITIIDTHAHLDQIDDWRGALSEAADAGVEAVLAVGVDGDANERNLRIQAETSRPHIYVALGIHPGNIRAERIEEDLDSVRRHADRAVAIGEIGLDYWYKEVRKNEERKELQREVFRRQLRLAAERRLPVVIHSRGAWQACRDMVREAGVDRGVFHWYSGPADVLKEILASGFYISATPSLAVSPQAREAVSAAPLDRLLIETDTPVFYKYADREGGFSSRPRDVLRTLELIAGLKGVPAPEAAVVLNHNAKTLFTLTGS